MRRAPVGPIVSRNGLSLAANIGIITAKERESDQVALALIPPLEIQRDIILVNPRAALTAGLLQSPLTPGADGNFRVGEANMTAGDINPAAENWDVLAVRRNNNEAQAGYVRAGSTGPIAASISSATIDHGNITTLTTLEATAPAILAGPLQIAPIVGDPVIISPRNALPAGLALSHARISAPGIVTIGVANPTAGDINPAAILWDMCVFSQTQELRGTRSGRRGVTRANVIDPPSIPALTIVEVAVTIPGAQIGDPVAVTGTNGMNIGLYISHARVSAPNTVVVGIGNITAIANDPPAELYVIQTFPRTPPL